MSTIQQITRPHVSCLRERALASIILAVVFSLPVSAFELRTNKFIDTFEQPYPAEWVQTPSSPERNDTRQNGPGAQEIQTPKTALIFSLPVSAFELRTNKFIDTFEQPYPAERVQAPPSPERDNTRQNGPGARETQTPKSEPEKVMKVARATRAISAKRSTSPLAAGVFRVFWKPDSRAAVNAPSPNARWGTAAP